MALDVHIVDDPKRQLFTEWPVCQFEEDVQGYMFHGCGIDIYNRYPLLRRMIDYYADAHAANACTLAALSLRHPSLGRLRLPTLQLLLDPSQPIISRQAVGAKFFVLSLLFVVENGAMHSQATCLGGVHEIRRVTTAHLK